MTYNASAQFTPIHAIFRQDADIHLVFLSRNSIKYSEPVDDNWYRTSATPSDMLTEDGPHTRPIYLPLEPASPLGCAEQHQFCRATSNSRQCGPMASLRDSIAGVAQFFDSSYMNFANDTAPKTTQEALFLYFANTLYSSPRSVEDIVGQLGQKALHSAKTLIIGDEGSLPPDQWQLDVINWVEIANAATQAAYIETAYGPTNPGVLQWRVNFTTQELLNLCNTQVYTPSRFLFISLSIFFPSLSVSPRCSNWLLENQKHSIRIPKCFWPILHINYWFLDHTGILSTRTYIRLSF